MHRVYRNDMQQAQKDKIAAAHTGKRLSQTTKDRISRALQAYWRSLPLKATGETDTATGTTGTTGQTLPDIYSE